MATEIKRHSKIGIIVPTPSLSNENFLSCESSIHDTAGHLNITIQPVVDSGASFRFSRSVNRGIQQTADSDAWVLVNDDCVFDDGWLDNMLETVINHPNVGLVGAIIRRPAGEIEHAGGFLTTTTISGMKNAFHQGLYSQALRMPLRNLIFRNSNGRIQPFHHKVLDVHNRLDFLTGACLLITRNVYETIGAWDEDYIFTWEDTDYSLRALEAGFELALCTSATATHKVRATGRKWSRSIWASGKTFREKWTKEDIDSLVLSRNGIYD